MSRGNFRDLALALPGAQEKSHFGKADIRVRNRIFAGFNTEGMAYVKLTPDQQNMLMASEPGILSPVPGSWGRKGWTLVNAPLADEPLLKDVLRMAWKNVAPKSLQT